MTSTKTVIVLLLMCAASLGAGVVAGKLAGHGNATPVEPIRVEKAGLADELSLSPEQRERMRHIWVRARDRAGDYAHQAQTAQVDQDQAIAALLSAEQRTKFNELTQKTQSRVSDLETRRKQAVQEAVTQTESILNDSQRSAYQEIVRSRMPELVGAAESHSAH